ncbi:hypothetical protein BKA83DRAFT_4482268 [Pisolithus microcarpus]|nr:hypothetical protein BKA83DRAFT_4482268 [Pisolithus microcarpus]
MMTSSSRSREDFSTEPGIKSSPLTLAATISGGLAREKRRVIPWDAPFTVSQDSAANIVLCRAPESPHSLRSLHNASKRLTVTELVDATVTLVVDALRLTFDSARTRLGLDPDRDMELFVADFHQCTRTDICSSPLPWLTKRSSFPAWASSSTRIWSGSRYLLLLCVRRISLYYPHILSFHWRSFASEGVIAAFSDSILKFAVKSTSCYQMISSMF